MLFSTFHMFFEMNERQLESKFQSKLIKELESMFPGIVIYKNEGLQGLPDLTLLYNDKWAWLECKAYEKASHQPGQDYYVELGGKMSFARFIYPENKMEVLDELQQTFRP